MMGKIGKVWRVLEVRGQFVRRRYLRRVDNAETLQADDICYSRNSGAVWYTRNVGAEAGVSGLTYYTERPKV